MKSWADVLVYDYYDWLKEKTVITTNPQSDWVSIDTPFVGVFNDTIEFYIKKSGNEILFSDDNQTINNLGLLGVNINRSEKRREAVDRILINYGIDLQGTELVSTANEVNFKQKKHNFLCAMLELNDLYVLSDHNVASIFKEDVRNYLDEIGVVYTPEFVAKGSVTKLDFTFDFQVAGKQDELVIKAFSLMTKPLISHFLFSWDDIKPIREKITRKNIKALAIINDEKKGVNEEYLDALKSKESKIMLWTQRHQEKNVSFLKNAS